MHELKHAIELEVMRLIEAGVLIAECEDDAIRTVLPIAFDDHLARNDFSVSVLGITDRRKHDRYAQLIVAMTCARPWWLPRSLPKRCQEAGPRKGQRQEQNLPTPEFVAALWKMNPGPLPAGQVSWAFKYYTRFSRSPDGLDLKLVRESLECAAARPRNFSDDRTLDHPHASAIRMALLEQGAPDRLWAAVIYLKRLSLDPGMSESERISESVRWALDENLQTLGPYTGPLDLHLVSAIVAGLPRHGSHPESAVAYFERFSKDPGVSESELIEESVWWAKGGIARSCRAYRSALRCPQVAALRAALLERGGVTALRLALAVEYYRDEGRSVRDSAELAIQREADKLNARERRITQVPPVDPYWAPWS
ncbi:hypothetical protein [Streptomyces coeruleorubidus]|uniref:hypothetical protein n=1 Tax=Streptomyces coeruleorubidus TaxID=116188 RepID=UPI00340EAF8F